ncbi:MAG: hypothetical protein ACREKS_10495 [Candidatus Rokuibacteriota bacterium]
MASDAPLLERLAQLDPVPAASALELLHSLPSPHQDPLLGPFFGVDEDGDAVVNALVPAVLQQFQDKGELTCYGALLEGLTGIWNAAVRTAVVAKLRASGLPSDDLLLRLQALSPTLGFRAEKGEWTREWLADPFSKDLGLVQQCVVRALLALRTMAEARASQLLALPKDPTPGGSG